MSENRGMGILLGLLGGNSETVSVIKSCLGNTIERVWLDERVSELRFKFTNGVCLRIWDDGQSCCECSRYMVTADDLSEYENATLLDFELKRAPNSEDEYGEHEIQFLDDKTDKGIFQMANHNEHNGYYGGFWIVARLF